jgi:hypothetical protein
MRPILRLPTKDDISHGDGSAGIGDGGGGCMGRGGSQVCIGDGGSAFIGDGGTQV